MEFPSLCTNFVIQYCSVYLWLLRCFMKLIKYFNVCNFHLFSLFKNTRNENCKTNKFCGFGKLRHKILGLCSLISSKCFDSWERFWIWKLLFEENVKSSPECSIRIFYFKSNQNWDSLVGRRFNRTRIFPDLIS